MTAGPLAASTWREVALGNVGRLFKATGGTKADEATVGIACIRYGEVYSRYGSHITTVGGRISPSAANDYTPLQLGDVIFAASGETLEEIGKCAAVLVDEPVVAGGDIVVFRPGPHADPGFLGYTLNAKHAIHQKYGMGKGVTVMHIYASALRQLRFPLPPLPTQRAIASFLDRETAKIDTLIEKKQRLLELLEEKRTALITRAVTKGLDPDVPMKDSGVEWLGEIPAHWDVLPLKHLGRTGAGAGFPHEEQGRRNEAIPFFKVGDMRAATNNVLKETDNRISEETAERLRATVFPAGTIVFAKVGAALFLNRRRILGQPSCIDNNLLAFIPGRCDKDWCFQWLRGLDLGRLANPGAVPSVNEGQVRNMPAMVPPREEQAAIARAVQASEAATEQVEQSIHHGVALLREYRTALISAAVTGKLEIPAEESAS